MKQYNKIFILLIFVNIYLLSILTAKENPTNVNGDIKFFYETNTFHNMFNPKSSQSDISLNILSKNNLNSVLKSNIGFSLISTLGLEQDIAYNAWIDHRNENNQLKDILWLDIANIEYSILEKSTIIFGRQKLNTPLFKSETWNAVTNTFDALKFNFNDFEYLNFNFMFITRGNASPNKTVKPKNLVDAGMRGFGNEHNDSMFIAGINSDMFLNTEINVWLYKMPNQFSAYWFEINRDDDNYKLGLQLVNIDPEKDKGILGGAIKADFNLNELVSIQLAYSKINNKNSNFNISNLAGAFNGTSISHLYTETYWNYGYVGRIDAQSFKIESSIAFSLMDIKVGAVFVKGKEQEGNLNEVYIESKMEYDIFDITLCLLDSKAANSKRINSFIAQIVIPFKF